jgi:dTMP kinase
MRNCFISVEGGEGVGKSLFLSLLHAGLSELKISVLMTREPGGTPIGEKIRELFSNPPISDPLTIEAELMLISAARAQHIQNLIKPSLRAGSWVLSDRYVDSTRIYQGVLGGISQEFVETVISGTTFGLVPDLTFVLDCDPEISIERIRARSQSDQDGASRYDNAKLASHRKIREGFRALASRFPERIVNLDASREPQVIAAQGIQIVKDRFIDKTS